MIANNGPNTSSRAIRIELFTFENTVGLHEPSCPEARIVGHAAPEYAGRAAFAGDRNVIQHSLTLLAGCNGSDLGV